MTVPLTPVKSSNLAKMGYDAAQQQLVVQYHDKDGVPGKTSQYNGVPPDVFAQLQGADSIGSFFYKNIRDNTDYEHSYLTPEDQTPAT